MVCSNGGCIYNESINKLFGDIACFYILFGEVWYGHECLDEVTPYVKTERDFYSQQICLKCTCMYIFI